MMGTTHADQLNPYNVDVLSYLANLPDNLSSLDQREHYDVLRPALLRIQRENPTTFDLALKDIGRKLGIKPKAVKTDLAAMQEPPAAKDARTLLEKMGQTRELRLAQDFVDDKFSYGIVAGDDTLVLTSERELLLLTDLTPDITVRDHGFDDCRISKEAILKFLSGGSASGYMLLASLQEFFSRFAVFQDPRIALLLAVWTLATYCYRIFRVFPYLALRSPTKRCGKSRVLDLLSLLAFNASPKTVHPTEAQLFRAPSRNGGTLLLDEVEALGKVDKGLYLGLLAVLNSGFEQNGTVARQVKDADGNFREVLFETYCPRAFAGINKTAETLEDRSILVKMQRRRASEKRKRFSPARLKDEVQALRDQSYVWVLTHAIDLNSVYDQADHLFSELASLDDRARDLWEPLISITAIVDAERGDKQRIL